MNSSASFAFHWFQVVNLLHSEVLKKTTASSKNLPDVVPWGTKDPVWGGLERRDANNLIKWGSRGALGDPAQHLQVQACPSTQDGIWISTKLSAHTHVRMRPRTQRKGTLCKKGKPSSKTVMCVPVSRRWLPEWVTARSACTERRALMLLSHHHCCCSCVHAAGVFLPFPRRECP